jgi:hypothetical protein
VSCSVHKLWFVETCTGKPQAQNTNEVDRPKFRTSTSEEGNFNDYQKMHTWKIKSSITFLIFISNALIPASCTDINHSETLTNYNVYVKYIHFVVTRKLGLVIRNIPTESNTIHLLTAVGVTRVLYVIEHLLCEERMRILTLKAKAQTVLFKDPVRTAL